MAYLHRFGRVTVAVLLFVSLSACLGTNRNIFRHHKPVTGSSPVLNVATRDELNSIIAKTYNDIQSFQASVNLTASEGDVQTKITDFTAIPGVIFFRKKANIRVRATLPALGLLAFDMVSDGINFRFLYPHGNTLFEGLNSAPATSPNKMENLRPEAFLSSMLVRPFDPVTEFIMMKDDTDEDNAQYRLEFNGRASDGTPIPGREIWFDREDLTIARQKVYNEKGDIVSDTFYSEWQLFNGVWFPAHIDINRRIDKYGVAIEIVRDKMEMNKPLADDQFTLPQSETDGVTVKVLQ